MIPPATRRPTRIDTMKDAKLLAEALRRTTGDPKRREFVLRLQRSFRTWGSLTPSMREALRR
jgi:hypothetical protein